MATGVVHGFKATVDNIKSNLAKGNHPDTGVISGILRDCCNKAQALLRKDPGGAQLHQICTEGFASCGWDFGTNRATGGSPPTIDQVQSMLESTAARLRSALDTAHVSPVPTAAELSDLALATDRLWALDVNRLHPENGDYDIDLQAGKSFFDKRDVARAPLFASVKPELLRRPTFASFIALLDNYTASTGQAEVVTEQERAEDSRFLDAILATPVMRYTHKYLVAKGLAPQDAAGFKQQLSDIWFQQYGRTRGVKGDSSGFEHVFVGEIKDGKVTGVHNWIQIYLEEKAGRLDYRGFIRPRARAGRSHDPLETEQVISINFSWQGVEKDASTVLIGTSPEFDIALYTMCFLAGGEHEKQLVKFGPYNVEITCYAFNTRGRSYVGTAYPGEVPLDRDEAATRVQSAFRGMQVRRNS